MNISLATLRTNILATLSTFPEADAHRVAEYLLWAEMSGNKTQGVIKLTGTEPLQNVQPRGPLRIEHETKLSQRIDAQAQPAIIAAAVAVEHAIEKAKTHGIGIIGVRNTYSSNGSQAYYVEKIACAGLIGFMCSRSPSSTTGFGSIDPLFGTNPLGFGFPTNDLPLIFDMATSAMTFYGLILAKARGESIPTNIAIDGDGNITTDPAAAMDGALLPFDHSYKGAGIGMMVEILAGPLVGSAFIDNKTFKEEWGTLVIAINPELLVDANMFRKHCSELIERIKSSRKATDVSSIRLPGERAQHAHARALADGHVDVDDVILKELKYI